MRKGTKFVNTDILSVMKSIVDGHTKYYQSDFDIDTELIKEAASKKERTERIFVWMCRESGTWLLKEKNVFIQGTRENDTFCFYAEQTSDDILAFVVEVTALDGNTVTGNLYALDYKLYYEHVKKAAVQAGSIVLHYEQGQRTIPPARHFGAYPDEQLGKFVSFQFMPQSPEQLECVLADEKRTRNKFKEDYEVLGYELYEYPESTKETGKYFCKTPILEQPETAVRKAGESGTRLFIKAVCSDGKKRYL